MKKILAALTLASTLLMAKGAPYVLPIQKNPHYLNGAQLKELLVEHTRAGKVRFNGKGITFKGILHKDGTANTDIYKNGKKIKSLPTGKWHISEDGTCCLVRPKKKKYDCRKIYKEGDHYIAVSNGEFWAKFTIEDK